MTTVTNLGEPESPYSEAGPEALLRLGLNVHAPLRDLRPTYERLLPEACAGGYFAALQAALGSGEVAAGDADDQLCWLAEHLRLKAPGDDELSLAWTQAWRCAIDTIGVTAPAELGSPARRVLLDELLVLPSYQLRLTDALIVALRTQIKS